MAAGLKNFAPNFDELIALIGRNRAEASVFKDHVEFAGPFFGKVERIGAHEIQSFNIVVFVLGPFDGFFAEIDRGDEMAELSQVGGIVSCASAQN